MTCKRWHWLRKMGESLFPTTGRPCPRNSPNSSEAIPAQICSLSPKRPTCSRPLKGCFSSGQPLNRRSGSIRYAQSQSDARVTQTCRGLGHRGRASSQADSVSRTADKTAPLLNTRTFRGTKNRSPHHPAFRFFGSLPFLRSSALQPLPPIRVERHGPTRVLLSEGQIAAKHGLEPAVRGPQFLVRHFDQRPLDLPNVFRREAPVALHEFPQVGHAVAGDPSRPVNVGINVAHDELLQRAEDGFAAVQPRITRARDGPATASSAEEKQDVVEVVLRLEIEQQGRIAVLLEDGRRSKRRLQAVSFPVPDDASERPQRLLPLFPVVRQRAQKRLDLSRRPVFSDDLPFLRAKGIAQGRGRRPRLFSLFHYFSARSACPLRITPRFQDFTLSHPLAFRPTVIPELKAKKRPKTFPVVSLPGPMLVEKPADKRRVEQSLALQPFLAKIFLEERAQISPHPLGDGDGKASLLPVNGLTRQPFLNGLFQDVLELKMPDFERGGQSRGKFHQTMVEEGRAQFERARHTRPIDFHEEVVLEVRPKIKIEHLGQRALKARTLEDARERRKNPCRRWRGAAALRQEELVELRGRKHAEPDQMTLGRVSFNLRQKAAEKKSHRHRPARNRKKSRQAAQDSAAENPRQAQVIFGELRAEVSRIAAEEFVAALAAEGYFDV